MAASGKKGKKPKGKTIALNDFLADTPQTVLVSRKSSNWADDVEEDDYFSRKEKVVLPTAPRATRSPDVDDEKIPNSPPFLAYISNLPYEVNEDEIADFFQDLQIVNVRLPRDDRQAGKLKGFGYVEFGSRDSLISALTMGDTMIKQRRMRIEVADNTENDRRRGGRDRDRDRDGPDRTTTDWRAGPREPLSGPDYDRDRGGFDRRAGGGGRRDFGSGGFRDGDRGFDRDRGFGSRDDRDRGFGGRDDRDRGFGGRDERDRGFGGRDDRDRGFGGRDDRDRGFGSRDGDRDRGFGDRDRGFGGRDFGSRPGGFGPRRDDFPPRSDADTKSRPRLNLQPRTKPVEEVGKAPPPAPSQSSIFGGAKPVDTAAREREIEERLAREKSDAPRPPPRDLSRSEDSRKDERVTYQPPGRAQSRDRKDERVTYQPPGRAQSRDRAKRDGDHGDEDGDDREQQRSPTEHQADVPADQDGRVSSPHGSDPEPEPAHRERDESPGRKYQPPRGDSKAAPPRRQGEREERRGEHANPPRGEPQSKSSDRSRPQETSESKKESAPSAENMPKYREQETPVFVARNKFDFLADEGEEDEGVADTEPQ